MSSVISSTRLADHLARERVDHVVERRAAQNTVVEGLHHVVVALDGRSRQTAQRAAILLVDDDVLRHVDQTARQITGVGRFQRRIGQTLTGTVRRDEVFEHRKSLLEVREDRVLDDLLTALDTRFLRLGHQTAHTAQLTDLLLRTSGAGVEHHVDRVETVVVLHQRVDHHLREFGVDVRPDVDDLVVTLVVGDQTHVVVLHDGVRTVVTLLHELLLLLGDNHRVEVERQTALESHAVTHVLDVVEERGHLVGAGLLHHHGDDVAQRTLRKHRIDVAHLLGNDLVEEDAADGRIFQDAHPLTVLVDVVHHALHTRRAGRRFFIVGDDRLLRAVEDQPLALDALARLGDVVESQNHVLRRTVIGAPLAGFNTLCEPSISNCASRMAALPRGRWTAIWSPSKSALKAVQASGCNCMALPSMSLGWKAWIPRRCSVGARFISTGCPLMTFSRIPQMTGILCGR